MNLAVSLIVLLLALAGLTAWYIFARTGKAAARRPQTLAAAPPTNYDVLPASYGRDRLVLMARDPTTLFTYWEVSATRQQEVSQELGTLWDYSHQVLRLYQLPGNDVSFGQYTSFTKVDVGEGTGSWYLNAVYPNTTYVLELGRELPNGKYFPLLRSNRVTTPRNAPSEVIDPQWPPLEAIWAQYGMSRQVGSKGQSTSAGWSPGAPGAAWSATPAERGRRQ